MLLGPEVAVVKAWLRMLLGWHLNLLHLQILLHSNRIIHSIMRNHMKWISMRRLLILPWILTKDQIPQKLSIITFTMNSPSLIDNSREWRKQRIEAIARREEESDRQREEDRRRAQAELASFLKEYQAKVEERRSKPIDLASFMSEFDGPERCNKGTATQAPIDWAAVQRLIKLLRVPEGNVAGSERFLQIIKAKAGSMQTE